MERSTPEAMAEYVTSLVELSNEQTGLNPESALSAFIDEFHEKQAPLEKSVVVDAVAILVRRAARTVSLATTQQGLAKLLYLATEVLPTGYSKSRVHCQDYASLMVDRLLEAGFQGTAITALNFLASIGMPDDKVKFNTWVSAIGDDAVLPCFTILARHSPSDALKWLLSSVADDDVVLNAISAVLDMMRYGELAVDPWGQPAQDTEMWARSQFASEVATIGNRDHLRSELQLILAGVDDKDYKKSAHVEGAPSTDGERNERLAEPTPPPSQLVDRLELYNFDPNQAYAEILQDADAGHEGQD